MQKKLCLQCGQPIDPKKLKKNGSKQQPIFCNRACFQAYRKQTGFYYRFSAFGLATQRQIIQQTGEAPGAPKRREILTQVRHLSGRRSKKKQDN